MSRLLVSLMASMLLAGTALAQSSPKECVAQMKAANAKFSADLNAGVKAGRIDAKERAALTRSHQNLVAMERKALADKKLSKAECTRIINTIRAEQNRLAAAMKTPAKGAAGPKACVDAIKRERAAYTNKMNAGIKANRIDSRERASLNKTHQQLVAYEKRAMSDHNLSQAECSRIHGMIVAESRKLDAALRSPAAKR